MRPAPLEILRGAMEPAPPVAPGPLTGCLPRARSRCADALPVPLSRATAWWALPACTAVLVAACNLGGALGTLIVSAVLIYSFVGVALSLALAPPATAAAEAPQRADVADAQGLLQHSAHGVVDGSTADGVVDGAGQPPARVGYLDAVRAALTVIVVVHHAAGALAGSGSLGLSIGDFRSVAQPILLSFQLLNQCFFMALFFFLSGLFAPPSVARKGVRGFLRDRGARLGLPFLPIYLVLAPGWMLVVQAAQGTLFSGFAPSYVGPLWFVVWLFVFSFAYASVANDGGPDRHVVCALPGPGTLALVGAGLGVVQALQLLFFPAFPLMPITFGSLPFDMAAFVAGVLARRNGWLAAPFPRALVWARARTARCLRSRSWPACRRCPPRAAARTCCRATRAGSRPTAAAARRAPASLPRSRSRLGRTRSS